jgi:AcrR family transcriptional regulator
MALAAITLDQTPTREAILDAAERRFADSGFSGASVREIAADVGLRNQASLYHYFPNKQALYETALRRRVDALLPLWQRAGERISAARTGASRADAMAAGLERVFDHLAAHPHAARLIERAGLDDNAYARSAVTRVLKPLYAAGVDVLRQTGGSWPADDLPHLAAGLYHLIFGYFANAALLQAVLDDDPRSDAMLARQRQFLIAAIGRLLA